jgi:hypothetical protein
VTIVACSIGRDWPYPFWYPTRKLVPAEFSFSLIVFLNIVLIPHDHTTQASRVRGAFGQEGSVRRAVKTPVKDLGEYIHKLLNAEEPQKL